MAYYADAGVRHLLRRAGFGATPEDLGYYGELRFEDAVNLLVNFEQVEDDVDANIGKAGYMGVTVRGSFQPNTVINDARQRWLFRMVHSLRPLQEKMTLFWHNHFATAYSKVAGAYGTSDGTRLMAAKPSEDPAMLEGQVETIRRLAVGSFRDLVIAMARDPAMLIWLDGRFNTRDEAAGELRPRADGTVQHGRRVLHGVRRLRGGPRLHRLEPQPHDDVGVGPVSVVQVRLQRLAARDGGQDVQLPRSTRTAAGPSRRGRPTPACRTAST